MNGAFTKNELRRKILLTVLFRFLLAFIFIGILLFVPAGSLKYFNGWLFIAGLLVPMSFAMIYLYINDPELLEKRMNLKEKENAQKKYVKLSIIFYIVAYIFPGLDYRFNWSYVPMWLVLVSLTVMICGYVMFIIVMMQNRYASRVIEIQNEQKLIDYGLYSIVRHPMYLSATILYISSALVLGSYFALIPMLILPFLLAFRIKNEEKVLLSGLPGYEEYMKKVRYRLIPFIW
jgi:protein-S-isoprenylcysteine O-methyltransferase Ste14